MANYDIQSKDSKVFLPQNFSITTDLDFRHFFSIGES